MPNKISLFVAGLLMAPGGTAWAQRTVDASTLTSLERPAVRLEFDEDFEYLGSQEFELYGVARAEQHFFAKAAGERIQRLYWVQFEHVLESSDHRYDYSNLPDRVTMGGHPFRTDRRVWDFEEMEIDAASDFGRALSFLDDRGYTIGSDYMRQRMVWVFDEARRQELLIIYAEDLRDYGLTAIELSEDEARWRAVAEQLNRRALAGLTLLNL